jgi:TolB-like protein/tetratricopeptide (TPR) repeat protein
MEQAFNGSITVSPEGPRTICYNRAAYQGASMTAKSLEPEQAVRDHLSAVLASTAFAQVDRLKRFLRFVVEETVSGRSEGIKEYSIGVEVFDREASFDPRTDPIVRVQARRLRARLNRYYEDEGRHSELRIELPKGSYAPQFHRRGTAGLKRSVTGTLAARNTVSVLPFADRSPHGDLSYFCEGISEEIIDVLTKVQHLRVVTQTNGVEPGAGRAATIISGSIRKSGDDLRITVQCVDSANGSYLWSETFDRKITDVFGVQREIAQTVLGKIKADAIGTDRRGAHRTQSLTAHNLYLQGRYHCSQRTDAGLRKALEFFEKAIEEDPQYAAAYSGLADTYSLLSHYGVLPPAEVWTKAAANAAWAVLLDDDLAEAHTSLAHVKATQDWDWNGSEHEYQRAISLDPRSATARHWYAVSCLVQLGRLDDALDEILLAQTLDPVSTIISRDTARVYFYRREFEAALEQCDRTIERDPYFSGTYWILGLVQEQLGDLEESIAAFQRGIQLVPDSRMLRGALGRVFALSGKTSKARQVIREIEEVSRQRYVSPFEPAMIYFALGDHDRGFKCLNKAAEERCFELISLNVDPRFDSLKGDSRLRAVAAQAGLL